MAYQVPRLIKPIFIEENFIAPIFNDVMEQELRTACEQMKEIDDERFRNKLVEFLSELIRFNGALLRKYEFDETKATRGSHTPIIPSRFERVNPQIRTCLLEFVTKGEYLSDYRNIQEILYFLYSGLREYGYSCSDRKWNRVELYCDLLLQLFDDLYSDNIIAYEITYK